MRTHVYKTIGESRFINQQGSAIVIFLTLFADWRSMNHECIHRPAANLWTVLCLQNTTYAVPSQRLSHLSVISCFVIHNFLLVLVFRYIKWSGKYKELGSSYFLKISICIYIYTLWTHNTCISKKKIQLKGLGNYLPFVYRYQGLKYLYIDNM